MAPTEDQVASTKHAAFEVAKARGSGKAKGTDRVVGKVGIVTGVGPVSGIGSKAAILYAREGAKALYLIDFSQDLTGFATQLAKDFPQCKVRSYSDFS